MCSPGYGVRSAWGRLEALPGRLLPPNPTVPQTVGRSTACRRGTFGGRVTVARAAWQEALRGELIPPYCPPASLCLTDPSSFPAATPSPPPPLPRPPRRALIPRSDSSSPGPCLAAGRLLRVLCRPLGALGLGRLRLGSFSGPRAGLPGRIACAVRHVGGGPEPHGGDRWKLGLVENAKPQSSWQANPAFRGVGALVSGCKLFSSGCSLLGLHRRFWSI